MNTNPGMLGRKLGCTQLFDEEGNILRVTALEVGPCVVTTKRTGDKDGYWALQFGFGQKPLRLVKKPQLAPYQKEGSPLKEKEIAPHRALREVRGEREFVEKYEVGQTVKVTDLFTKGDLVDVIGVTKGRGFAGVVKRHGFHGADAGHGTHEYFRHSGSVGQNMTPGRTFKGMKMGGHMGVTRFTAQSLKVVDVSADDNILLVRGAVPGAKKGLIMVRKAARTRKTKAAAAKS